jgi:hypothetical protein
MSRPARSALLVCSGCSTVRFAYNNADIYLRWQLGKYLDVRGARARSWTGTSPRSLPGTGRTRCRNTSLVNEAKRRFARGVSQEDLVWGYDSIQAQVLQAVRAGAGEIAICSIA